MSYLKPQDVISPKHRWQIETVLHDGGEGGWAAAEGKWENDGCWRAALGIRWNGNDDDERGRPKPRGFPTFFIVPEELECAIRDVIAKLCAGVIQRGGPAAKGKGRWCPLYEQGGWTARKWQNGVLDIRWNPQGDWFTVPKEIEHAIIVVIEKLPG